MSLSRKRSTRRPAPPIFAHHDHATDSVIAHLAACGVAVEAGPVQRTGARGPLSRSRSATRRNLIELANALDGGLTRPARGSWRDDGPTLLRPSLCMRSSCSFPCATSGGALALCQRADRRRSEGIMAAHARLFAAHGVPVLTFAGRGGAGTPGSPARSCPNWTRSTPKFWNARR